MNRGWAGAVVVVVVVAGAAVGGEVVAAVVDGLPVMGVGGVGGETSRRRRCSSCQREADGGWYRFSSRSCRCCSTRVVFSEM